MNWLEKVLSIADSQHLQHKQFIDNVKIRTAYCKISKPARHLSGAAVGK